MAKLNIQRSPNIQPEGPIDIPAAAYMPNYQPRYAKGNKQVNHNVIEDGYSFDALEGELDECVEVADPVDRFALSTYQITRKEMELENDLNSAADCKIRWEDLIFKEEIGHGKDVVTVHFCFIRGDNMGWSNDLGYGSQRIKISFFILYRTINRVLCLIGSVSFQGHLLGFTVEFGMDQ